MGRPQRVERKLGKKVSRLGNSVEEVMAVGAPTPLPPLHLQTRRERMLGRALKGARKAEHGAAAGQKKQVAVARKDAAVVTANPEGAAPTRVKKPKAKADPAVVAMSLHNLSRRMQRNQTVQNLHSNTRHRIYVAEMDQMKIVTKHPQFIADPMSAIQAHLDNTMVKLKPATADYGRQPAGAATAPVSRGGHSQRGGRQ